MEFLWVLTHVGLVAGFLLAVLVVAHLLREQRSPSGTMAWLLVIVLLPHIGVPLYLILGGRKMRRIAASKQDLTLASNGGQSTTASSRIERLLAPYNIPGATDGNRLTLYHSGEEAYARLVDLIETARTSLHIMTFILRLDEVGRDILARLTRRAREGVEVRLLLDGVGSLHTRGRPVAEFVKAGGRIEFFMPVLHRPFRGRTNLRNHRKIAIGDGRRVIAGGANIAHEYIGPRPAPGRWRDLTFLLEGPAVRHYADIFRADWLFAGGDEFPPHEGHLPVVGEATVQVVPSGPDVEGDTIYAVALSAAFAARQRVWVVTPYFVPDPPLAQAFILAAHRGVDVRIIIPRKSNHRLADLASRTYLRDIQAAGGRVYCYMPGMMHGKAMLMDDEVAMIGSANMDSRSLFLNYEAALFVYSKPDIRAIERWIDETLAHTRVGMRKVGAARELIEGVARLAAPLL